MCGVWNYKKSSVDGYGIRSESKIQCLGEGSIMLSIFCVFVCASSTCFSIACVQEVLQ